MTVDTEPAAKLPQKSLCALSLTLAFLAGWWNVGLVKEGGALELSTVVALCLTTVVLICRDPRLAFGSHWHLPALTALLAMRELDFDKRFIETGILKLRLYTGDAPFVLKVFGVAVIALVLICLYRLLRHDGRRFLMAVQQREAWALAILAGIFAVIVAKSIDGLGRKLAPFGISLSDAQGLLVIMLEETLELGFAVALLSAAFLWHRRHV